MIKTATFAVVHFSVAFSVTCLLTGSWVLGGLIAMLEPTVNTVAYFFHEKAWECVSRRRQQRSDGLRGVA
ncbi:hypothetical protein GCM10007160_32440 [Litchfieldella qijiaojingensis]|uniref:DUF2061 domain-containing protein n=1 Tax=Litchfieldella qijiaojingensis TaxID=980347 RepID=A0ABQ2Z2A6_9GAMM|nr:DUF2061 domain-containing protein [Halomonas qijiaojingensis]GGY01997.1 hypothetical protein GCM10007160_32440 [Halomonas qijiaojingensis]